MKITLALAAFVAVSACEACSFAQPKPVDVDPSVSRQGDVAPLSPKVTVESVSRGNANDPLDSCGDTGVVVLAVQAKPETIDLIYSFEQVSGQADDVIFQSGTFEGYEHDGKVLFVFPWLDGATNEQEPLDLVVRVTPYLRSGLSGPSTDVQVRDDGR